MFLLICIYSFVVLIRYLIFFNAIILFLVFLIFYFHYIYVIITLFFFIETSICDIDDVNI